MKKVVVLALLALLQCNLARSQQSPEYEYAIAFIDSLRWAERADARGALSETVDVSDIKTAFDEMIKVKTMAKDYEQAASSIEDYTRSITPMVNVGAGMAHKAYTDLMRAHLKLADLIAMLHGRTIDKGALLSGLSDFKVAKQGAWDAINTASTFAGMPSGTFTPQQRTQLVRDLRAIYGGRLEAFIDQFKIKPTDKNTTPAIVPAAVLYRFLTPEGASK